VSGAARVLTVAVDALVRHDAHAWRSVLAERLRSGRRLVTLFGRRAGDAVTVTAVHQGADGELAAERTVLDAAHGVHELTSELPALHCFERELHEQTGVRIAGHPWLKPIRFEGQKHAAMNDYPFYSLEGKEVHEVAVGPIHAGVIEPGSFRFMCLGEQVHHLEIHLGYQHRGVEALLRARPTAMLWHLVQTISGDSTVAHGWAHAAALEALAGVDVGAGVDLGRAFALELERVAMHLASLSGLAADTGALQAGTTWGRLRTTAINTSMRFCGSRFGRGAVRPFGSGMRASEELSSLAKENLELLERDVTQVNHHFLDSALVRRRFSGVGTVTTAQATELGLVGHAARSSGVALDARQNAKQGAYAARPIEAVTLKDGDVLSRGVQRMREVRASLAWLKATVERPVDWTAPRASFPALAPNTLAVSLVEGWRGEVVHALETGPSGELVHAKVQDPSLRNWMGLAQAVRANEISDFPICNKSFDLSYCGNDL
jgi:Ni,Fe-hydrogenase III large subunit